MKKAGKRQRQPEMAKEYDFRGGVRGKYAARYAQGTNVIVLEPDVAKVFHDSASVNRALRLCEQMGKAMHQTNGTRRRKTG